MEQLPLLNCLSSIGYLTKRPRCPFPPSSSCPTFRCHLQLCWPATWLLLHMLEERLYICALGGSSLTTIFCSHQTFFSIQQFVSQKLDTQWGREPICWSPSDPETLHVIGMPQSLSGLCAFVVPDFANNKILQIPKTLLDNARLLDNTSVMNLRSCFLQNSIFLKVALNDIFLTPITRNNRLAIYGWIVNQFEAMRVGGRLRGAADYTPGKR